jgi:hypothetical protein
MTATPLLDKCRNDCRLCWFSADSLNARVDALICRSQNQNTQNLSAQNTRCSITPQFKVSQRGETGLVAASLHHMRA